VSLLGSYVRPRPAEVAIGFFGREDAQPVEVDSSAREALERAILGALEDGPCHVSFSGGRDSSAVLAVATHVARQHGLALPVPVIQRYPGFADADETGWQDLVLTHLGLDNAVVHVDADPIGYLGDAVKANLERRGLVWPPAIQIPDPVLETARGGTLLTGEGGDEVLGPRRVTPLTLLVKLRRRPSRRLVRWCLRSLAPARLRRFQSPQGVTSWLTEAGRNLLERGLTREASDVPLRWDSETRSMLGRRVPAVLKHNVGVCAREYDVTMQHPLLDAGFISALAREGGAWGYAGRTDLMRHLFADVLPEEVLARSTKAHFGQARWGDAERGFARAWDGSGLPGELIDTEALRAHWLSERPQGSSALALHAAWLASENIPIAGRP